MEKCLRHTFRNYALIYNYHLESFSEFLLPTSDLKISWSFSLTHINKNKHTHTNTNQQNALVISKLHCFLEVHIATKEIWENLVSWTRATLTTKILNFCNKNYIIYLELVFNITERGRKDIMRNIFMQLEVKGEIEWKKKANLQIIVRICHIRSIS